MRLLLLYIFALLTFHACRNDVEEDVHKGDELLAKVGNKSLYLSDLKTPQTSHDSSEDSLSILNSYVEQWVRRMIILDHAEKTISPDININELVDDYRASLVLHNYRSDIVDKKLDTLISPAELQNFYDNHKEQYILSESLLRGIIVKFPQDLKGLDKLYKNWRSDKYDEIQQFSNDYGVFTLLDTTKWYGINEFYTYLPDEAFDISELDREKSLRNDFQEFEYFVKILSFVKSSDPPPLSYIEDKIKKVIINARKKALLEDIENSLYENALDANNIKVYTK